MFMLLRRWAISLAKQPVLPSTLYCTAAAKLCPLRTSMACTKGALPSGFTIAEGAAATTESRKCPAGDQTSSHLPDGSPLYYGLKVSCRVHWKLQ